VVQFVPWTINNRVLLLSLEIGIERVAFASFFSLTIYISGTKYVDCQREAEMAPMEKTDLLQGTLDMLILKIGCLGSWK
jgi:hypothetical protein